MQVGRVNLYGCCARIYKTVNTAQRPFTQTRHSVIRTRKRSLFTSFYAIANECVDGSLYWEVSPAVVVLYFYGLLLELSI